MTTEIYVIIGENYGRKAEVFYAFTNKEDAIAYGEILERQLDLYISCKTVELRTKEN